MANNQPESIDYFNLRGVLDYSKENFSVPPFLSGYLPDKKSAKICDLGCGFGRLMIALRNIGYTEVTGVDQDKHAVAWCLDNGLSVKQSAVGEFIEKVPEDRYDLLIMSHVLEHIDKDKIIYTLQKIKDNLLHKGGAIIIMVPNAQSSTGCYWAYEDFTHSTLFTAGSLLYVLQAAGFKNIELIDPQCTAGLSWIKKNIRIFLLKLYRLTLDIPNKITLSSFHKPSPSVYSFEIKIIAHS